MRMRDCSRQGKGSWKIKFAFVILAAAAAAAFEPTLSVCVEKGEEEEERGAGGAGSAGGETSFQSKKLVALTRTTYRRCVCDVTRRRDQGAVSIGSSLELEDGRDA